MNTITSYRLARLLAVLVVPALLIGYFVVRSSQAAERADEKAQLLKDAQGAFEPLPKDMATKEHPVSAERVNLGRKLFFDPRISADGTVGCARCHQAALYATDGLPQAHGAHDKVAPRNAPTVFNVAIQFKQHWAGELGSVEEQAKAALIAPAFDNKDFETAMARVKAISGYTELFKKAFPGETDPVTADNWGTAIGAYERTLVSPSRFDEYIGGKTDALSADEQRGLRIFMDVGCADCHSGAGVGGSKFGINGDYWKVTGSKEIDKGRFNTTKRDTDLYVFKVPILRNVEMTPPYFHDGSVRTLPEAVSIMAQVQLGKTLSDDETKAIVTFLKSLTGTVPPDFATAPVLPPAGFQPPVSK